MGFGLVKRKEPEDALLISKSVSSGVRGSSITVASSSIAIQVFDNVYCFCFVFYFILFYFYVSYNSHIVTGSVTICIICNCIIDLCLCLCFIVMLIQ